MEPLGWMTSTERGCDLRFQTQDSSREASKERKKDRGTRGHRDEGSKDLGAGVLGWMGSHDPDPGVRGRGMDGWRDRRALLQVEQRGHPRLGENGKPASSEGPLPTRQRAWSPVRQPQREGRAPGGCRRRSPGAPAVLTSHDLPRPGPQHPPGPRPTGPSRQVAHHPPQQDGTSGPSQH